MFKKSVLLFLISIQAAAIFANDNKIKFIKGNISDKTLAVKEASGEEENWLCEQALDFVLTNKEILGNDRELDGLAIATVLSFSNSYISNLTEKQKYIVMNKFQDLFVNFQNSATVQSTLINKIISLKKELPYSDFVDILNSYISKKGINNIDNSLVKEIFHAYEEIGNNQSFLILFEMLDNPLYKDYNQDIKNTLSALIPASMNEIISIIHNKNIDDIYSIFSLVQNNNKISKNFICEIAENVLNESIILMQDSSKVSDKILELQINSLNILSENRWTRASSNALTYFDFSKTLFGLEVMNEDQMVIVVQSLAQIAPLNAVTPLSKYLEELNAKKEQNLAVSTKVVLSVVNSLGAIGDKYAFDSLLATTYLSYPEAVLSAARNALAGLRW